MRVLALALEAVAVVLGLTGWGGLASDLAVLFFSVALSFGFPASVPVTVGVPVILRERVEGPFKDRVSFKVRVFKEEPLRVEGPFEDRVSFEARAFKVRVRGRALGR